VQGALGWLRRSITGQEPMRYYKRGTCGPGFACGINEGQPCGWGAVEALEDAEGSDRQDVGRYREAGRA